MSSKRRITDRITGSGSNAAVVAIVSALTLPEEAAEVRYADQFTSKQTALAKTFREDKINWSAVGPVADRQLTLTDMMVFLFRNALRHIVRYDPNALSASMTYRIYISQGGVASSAIASGGLGVIQVRPIYLLAVGAYQPHGTTLFTGRDPNCEQPGLGWFWLDSPQNNSTIRFTLSADPGVQSQALRLFRWRDGVVDVVSMTNTAAGVLVYNVSAGAGSSYYGVALALTGGGLSVQIDIIANSSIWCHLPMQGIVENMNSITGLRMLGASLRWTNQASPLNQQGNIVMVAVGPGEDWTNFGVPGYGKVASYADGESRLLATGAYTYLKPYQEKDFELTVPFYHGNGLNDEVSEASFPLEAASGFSVLAASCTVPEGCDTKMRITSLIEFTTDNQFFATLLTPFLVDDWAAALEMIKSMESFYENPVHSEQIWSTIGKFARLSGRVLGMIPHPFAQSAAAFANSIGMGLKRFK